MARNAELIREIADHIESEPEHWNQASFTNADGPEDLVDDEGHLKCGTTLCIAGWACFLSGRSDALHGSADTEGVAADLMGIENGRESTSMFYGDTWLDGVADESRIPRLFSENATEEDRAFVVRRLREIADGGPVIPEVD